MSYSVPESTLTTQQLGILSNFRRELANALDSALVEGAGLFSSTDDGIVPMSGGGIVNFLRADGTWTAPSSSNVYNVKTQYGASGLGLIDDRAAIQNAIDAARAAGGGTVWIPNGTYSLTQGAGFFCLTLPSDVTIEGESRAGVILKQAVVGDSVRLFRPTGTDITIRNMTLDGNKDNNTTQEHRHGVFAETTERLRIECVTAQNFTGDGFYFYTNANDSLVIDCYATANERNGLTLGGGGQSGCIIVGGQYTGNAIQQIDSEPGGTTQKITILGARLTPGATDDFALTVSGFNAGTRAKNWHIVGCIIDGPINCVWAESIAFIGCSGVSTSTTLPHLRIYRSCSKISSVGCHWASPNVGSDAAVVHVTGTGSGDAPELVEFSGGSIRTTAAIMYGVVANGCTSLSFNNVQLEGAAVALHGSTHGIYVRSTTALNHVKSVVIHGCTFKNFGNGGVMFDGTSGAEFIYNAAVTACSFDSTVAGVMPNAITWNHPATPFNAVQKATSIGNRILGNVTTMNATYPTCPILIGGNDGPGAIYSCAGTPEGAIVANLGAMALRRDGGGATTLYVKTADDGLNTGWTAK
jgi:hypothetical protein